MTGDCAPGNVDREAAYNDLLKASLSRGRKLWEGSAYKEKRELTLVRISLKQLKKLKLSVA
jgi:hypothetical protein